MRDPYLMDIAYREAKRQLSNAAAALAREGCERCENCNGLGGGYNGEDGTEWECDVCWSTGWVGPALRRQQREVA